MFFRAYVFGGVFDFSVVFHLSCYGFLISFLFLCMLKVGFFFSFPRFVWIRMLHCCTVVMASGFNYFAAHFDQWISASLYILHDFDT